MRDEEHFKWMIMGVKGRMVMTRFTCDEAFIRNNHPEAVRVDSTRVVRQIAETDHEIQTRHQRSRNMKQAPKSSK